MTRRTPNVSDNRPNTKPVITAPMPWPVINHPTARLPPPSSFSTIAGINPMNGATKRALRHSAWAVTRRPGCDRTNANPSRIAASIGPVERACSGTRSVSRTATTARKLTALTPSTHAIPAC